MTAALPAEAAPDARALRRHTALVAFLSASQEFDFEALDPANPLLSNATIAEFRAAVEEASRKTLCPLTKTLGQWLDGRVELEMGAPVLEWLPLREARYKDLRVTIFLENNTYLISNHLEVFQVAYRAITRERKKVVLYHVQPLVGRETPAYYRRLGTEPPQRLLALPATFPAVRNPAGLLAPSLLEKALTWPTVESVNPLSLPLHEIVGGWGCNY